MKAKMKINEDMTMLPEDQTYCIDQCILQRVHPINIDWEGVPTQLVDDEPAVVDNPYKNVHTMDIPMNQMVENCKRDGIERPNILLPPVNRGKLKRKR